LFDKSENAWQVRMAVSIVSTMPAARTTGSTRGHSLIVVGKLPQLFTL
jgi:hypothetical protein